MQRNRHHIFKNKTPFNIAQAAVLEGKFTFLPLRYAIHCSKRGDCETVASTRRTMQKEC